MPWPQTGGTHYHAQLRFTNKDLTIKGLVVVWLGSKKGLGPRTCARCAGLVPYFGKDGY